MYRLLLSWRYLRTRFIALASIISVTLGVATLIVVNSVMSGFVEEMKDKLHGILSDVEMSAPGLGEINWPELHVQEIEKVVGDEIETLTHVVRVPALMNFEFRGRQWTQQVMLMGIDEKSFGKVTDFLPYMMNVHKRENLSFELEESGYDERLGKAGWEYRRIKAENKKQLDELMGRGKLQSVAYHQEAQPQANKPSGAAGSNFQPLPDSVPDLDEMQLSQQSDQPAPANVPALNGFDRRSALRPQIAVDDMFDASRDQYTGIVLGLAISNRPFVNQETGEKDEMFMIRPGDDIQITLPTAGSNPQAVTQNCTVVDFYSSNMHEYDSSFAFVPLKKLQEMRRMIDPTTGASSVSAIQMKLKPGADLNDVRDRLIARFPPSEFPYAIQTWQDTQGPLLSAVNLEVTILNILLFLIIAVAGFGILATFYMIVVEKTKDIGILKALGAPSGGVMSIFLAYGLSLGFVGTGVGIVLGLVFVANINLIADFVQVVTGQEVFDPTIYYFNKIPTIINPLTVFLVAVGAIAIAVMASVLPALRAARLHPVEALRYE